jgi:hypothetical protein
VRWAGAAGPPGFVPRPPDFDPKRDLTVDGDVLVADNYIDLDPDGASHYDFLRAVGIESTQTKASTRIVGNIVKNTSHAGILVTDNFRTHVIQGNRVVVHNYPDGKQVLFPTGASFGAEGIAVVAVFFPEVEPSASLIVDNRVSTGGEAIAGQNGGAGPAALGIMVSGPHRALRNLVTMDGGYAAAFVWLRPRALFDRFFPGFLPPGDASGSLIAGNTFAGNARFLYTSIGRRDDVAFADRATRNVLLVEQSEVESFTATDASGCEIFLPAFMHGNTVMARADVTVCDEGTRNRVIVK